MKNTFYVRVGKRCFDTAGAAFGLLLILPILLLTGLAVKLSSRGPIFFRQLRVGQFGRIFVMFKFRSMRTGGTPGSNLTASGDPRITPLGRWLRRTKIDELPQLFNVLLGQMSLVGPRPEVSEFVNQYTETQREVLNVRPGITGPSANVYEEELLASRRHKEEFYLMTVLPAKLAIDFRYCETIAFSSDLRILFQTFAKLLTRVNPSNKIVHYAGGTPFEVRTSKK
jgi:lipopolysaccharide/colanic/teichoic acid biosynthesis glycosyltransferase